MAKNKFDKSLMLSVFDKSDLIEIGLQGVEAGIDALLRDSVLALIPGASIAGFALKIPKTLENKLFEISVTKFQKAHDEAELNEWEAWVERLENTDGGLDRAGEVLLRFLNTTDDSKKAHALGLVYAAAAREQITIDEMYRFQMILDRVFWPDLEEIAAITHKFGDRIDEPNEAFIFLGILNRETLQTFDDIGGPDFACLTKIGRKFLHIVSDGGQLR